MRKKTNNTLIQYDLLKIIGTVSNSSKLEGDFCMAIFFDSSTCLKVLNVLGLDLFSSCSFNNLYISSNCFLSSSTISSISTTLSSMFAGPIFSGKPRISWRGEGITSLIFPSFNFFSIISSSDCSFFRRLRGASVEFFEIGPPRFRFHSPPLSEMPSYFICGGRGNG